MKNRNVVLSAYIANMFEAYDFIITGMLIAHISPLFFPKEDPISSILAGLLVFSAGFFMRPLGAMFFGFVGDSYGRKKALLASIFGMTFATLSLGVLPSYATLGILSPLLFFILRLIQGFCIGGEGQGSMVLALEYGGGQNSGRLGSIMATSNGMAALLAFSISLIATSSWVPEWAWRLCYLFGASLGFVGLYLRKHVDDSPIFHQPKVVTLQKNPLRCLVKQNKMNMLSVFLVVGMGSALTYTGFTFINVFLTQFRGYTSAEALTFALVGNIIGMGCVLVGGRLCDRWGPARAVEYFALALFVLAIPLHYLLAYGDNVSISIALLMLAITTGGICGVVPHFTASSFPTSHRYSGASISNNLAQAFLGGAQPVIAMYLIRTVDLLWAPAIYLMVLSAVFLVYAWGFREKLTFYEYTPMEA